MKIYETVEIPYEHLRHLNWNSLILTQIDIWDEVRIRRDPERFRLVVEYLGREEEEHETRLHRSLCEHAAYRWACERCQPIRDK